MDLYNDALVFAIEKHSGQTRKLADTPYIVHPLEVSVIVSTMTNEPETLAAAVLHDTIEDAGVTYEEICERFGKRTALLVMTETEDKREDRPPAETWHLRKEETLLILKNTKDIEVKKLWLGDKLSNIRSFYRAYLKEGDALWQHFNQKDPREQAWYYRTIASYLAELKDYDAYKEFTSLTDKIFENIGEGETEHEILF